MAILGLEVAFGKQVYLPIYLDTFPNSAATSEGILFYISVHRVGASYLLLTHVRPTCNVIAIDGGSMQKVTRYF